MFHRISSSLFLSGLLLASFTTTAIGQTSPPPARESYCPKLKNTVLSYVDRLKSTDDKERLAAMEWLGNFGPAVKNDASAALVALALGNRDRTPALTALAKIDPQATRDVLRKILLTPTGCKIRRSQIIEPVAKAGEPMAPHLVALLAEREIAGDAAEILQQIGAPALPYLIRDLQERMQASAAAGVVGLSR